VKAQAEKIRAGTVPEGYPESWPAPDRPGQLPPGTAPYTPAIQDEIRKRRAKIRAMLTDETLSNFPRQEVAEVLAFWKIDISPDADPRA